jgi:hypothetical protein
MSLRQIIEAALEVKLESERLSALQARKADLQGELASVNAEIAEQQPIVQAKIAALKTLVNE